MLYSTFNKILFLVAFLFNHLPNCKHVLLFPKNNRVLQMQFCAWLSWIHRLDSTCAQELKYRNQLDSVSVLKIRNRNYIHMTRNGGHGIRNGLHGTRNGTLGIKNNTVHGIRNVICLIRNGLHKIRNGSHGSRNGIHVIRNGTHGIKNVI